MKICIFSRPFYPAVGGLEQMAKILAYEFAALNCNVEVVTDTLGIGDDNKFPFNITRTSSFKKRYVAFKHADIVLFMNFTFSGVPVAMLARTPIVLSHHGVYRFSGVVKTQIIEFTKRQLTRLFFNISVSHYVANNIPGKSTVIPNAYDNQLFRYTQVHRIRDFVFCGRLVSDKGVDILIDAFKLVLQTYPSANLTIIGEGPDRKKLEVQAGDINKANILFTGILRDKILVDKLQEHTCMVIPSLWDEPFGIVALEGIASCDTVISSNCGGLPEAVGECGILIEPTIENFASKMKEVLHSKKNNSLLSGQPTYKKRIDHLNKHRPNIMAQSYLDFIYKALK